MWLSFSTGAAAGSALALSGRGRVWQRFSASSCSDRQKDNHTIASQTAGLKEYAQRQGYAVTAEWVFEDEGYSGANLARPGLEALRELAAAGQIEDEFGRQTQPQLPREERFAGVALGNFCREKSTGPFKAAGSSVCAWALIRLHTAHANTERNTRIGVFSFVFRFPSRAQAPAVADHRIWGGREFYRVAELDLVVGNAVSADDGTAGFAHFRQPAAHDLLKSFGIPLGRITSDRQGRDRLAPHGIDVAERIGGGNGSKGRRVINDRREEIHCLD